ncbi:urea amidolyase family protein [Comamonas flocculans]|uniref:5-oxoprolinase/urea amidolyase family protein n=1 Tax=Comamonas flocculans TaxID=2597701 RepID=A0A5B8S1I0_9BURK|nr:urea amidolyase family protein [Comamonas flocculans]QEA14507.1 5-oxoprolinase/urea amidolyase family protein [Comamonas flocculans]
MRILPAGDGALLLELPDLAQTLALYRALQATPVDGVRELVPAARTLLLHYRRERTTAQTLARAVRTVAATLEDQAQPAPPPDRRVQIAVHYDGEDLAELAEHLGLTARELVQRHCAQPWQAAFAGFAPGFVYLTGGDDCFARVPRRKTPRTRVPAGSVALAGGFSAVYPKASPGGWQLIGRTEAVMWDTARPEPALVQPGFEVCFVEAGRVGVALGGPSPRPSPQRGEGAPRATATGVSLPLPLGEGRGEGLPEEHKPNPKQTIARQALTAIEIVNTGLQTLMQDQGRHGLAGLGISASGALDLAAMRQANQLVGNPPDAPVLEHLLGGLQLRAHGRVTLALAGADMPLTLQALDGRRWPLANHAALALDDGDVLTVAAPRAGVRGYLAVRGGWQMAPELGSCARDTLAEIGPAALQPGQRLAVGRAIAAQRLSACAPAQAPRTELPRPGDEVVLNVLLGPRTDWFTPEAVALLQAQAWRVTPQSNRVGMRLMGAEPLTRSRHDELPSEGTAVGAIQVPASGQPVLFLADHPLTGGYPVIAVVASHHLGLAAQIPVGCSLRFRAIAPFEEIHE